MTTFLTGLIMAAVCSAIVDYNKRAKGRDFNRFSSNAENGSLNAGAAC